MSVTIGTPLLVALITVGVFFCIGMIMSLIRKSWFDLAGWMVIGFGVSVLMGAGTLNVIQRKAARDSLKEPWSQLYKVLVEHSDNAEIQKQAIEHCIEQNPPKLTAQQYKLITEIIYGCNDKEGNICDQKIAPFIDIQSLFNESEDK